jgi:hypothetical protein
MNFKIKSAAPTLLVDEYYNILSQKQHFPQDADEQRNLRDKLRIRTFGFAIQQLLSSCDA